MSYKTRDYGWQLGKGRVRIGYVTYKQWLKCPYHIRCWYYFFGHYTMPKVIQCTILGLQIGFCYDKDFKRQTP